MEQHYYNFFGQSDYNRKFEDEEGSSDVEEKIMLHERYCQLSPDHQCDPECEIICIDEKACVYQCQNGGGFHTCTSNCDKLYVNNENLMVCPFSKRIFGSWIDNSDQFANIQATKNIVGSVIKEEELKYWNTKYIGKMDKKKRLPKTSAEEKKKIMQEKLEQRKQREEENKKINKAVHELNLLARKQDLKIKKTTQRQKKDTSRTIQKSISNLQIQQNVRHASAYLENIVWGNNLRSQAIEIEDVTVRDGLVTFFEKSLKYDGQLPTFFELVDHQIVLSMTRDSIPLINEFTDIEQKKIRDEIVKVLLAFWAKVAGVQVKKKISFMQFIVGTICLMQHGKFVPLHPFIAKFIVPTNIIDLYKTHIEVINNPMNRSAIDQSQIRPSGRKTSTMHALTKQTINASITRVERLLQTLTKTLNFCEPAPKTQFPVYYSIANKNKLSRH